MGKRGKRTSKKKPLQDLEGNTDLSYAPDLDSCLVKVKEKTPKPEEDIPDIFQIQEFKEEMGRALKQICIEYLKDFQTLRDKRLDKKIPVEQTPNYKLTVEADYRRQLARKVQYIAKYDNSMEGYHILQANIEMFVNNLKDQLVKSIIPVPVKVALVCDAFSTLKNAAREIGKIVHYMFSRNRSQQLMSCEKSAKLIFRHRIFEDSDMAEDIANFKAKDASKRILLHTLDRLEKEMPDREYDIAPMVYYGDSYDTQSSCSSDYSSDENIYMDDPVQQMSVDELMVYINGNEQGTPPKASKKSRRKRKKQQLSGQAESTEGIQTPVDDKFEAKVEEFKRKLEMVETRNERIKPNLSAEWVASLREMLPRR